MPRPFPMLSLYILVFLLMALVVAFFGVNVYLSAPGFQGNPSDNYDGINFQNRGDFHETSVWGLIKWLSNRKLGYWPEYSQLPQHTPEPSLDNDGVKITYVNHSTFLIQTDSFSILTDPIWSERASPFQFAGPKRQSNPGIRFEELPPIDLVLISHNHYDHMDIPTLQKLAKRDQPMIISPLGNAAFLMEENCGEARDMNWWEQYKVNDMVSITCLPAQHFSGRGMFDRNKTLWSGYSIEIREFGRIFFAGDTGFGPHFQEIREQISEFKVGLIPIGAYKPNWFMSPVHISPAEAVDVHQMLNIETSIGMHWGTFPLADDGYEEPVSELRQVLELGRVNPASFVVLRNGEFRHFQ